MLFSIIINNIIYIKHHGKYILGNDSFEREGNVDATCYRR